MTILECKVMLSARSELTSLPDLFFSVPVNHRQATHSSSAAPSRPTPTSNLGRRLQSFCSSWTACGRSSASFPAPLSSARASLCCSSNTPTPPSSGLFWATVRLRGKPDGVSAKIILHIKTYVVTVYWLWTVCMPSKHFRFFKSIILTLLYLKASVITIISLLPHSGQGYFFNYVVFNLLYCNQLDLQCQEFYNFTKVTFIKFFLFRQELQSHCQFLVFVY